jgi:hypothetical protein
MPNRLLREKSPYLLQHAHNPVDWYPWGEEAFARARADEKPIFLSIGYSTCHWCHVMEHESFESEEIAGLLNRHFVSIKVDREERPDVDRVYMRALQSLGENGGWPLSMFLTPDLKPFFGGTYFPPVRRHGRISFGELLERIHDVWTTDRARVTGSADHLLAHLRSRPAGTPGDERLPDSGALELCFRQFGRMFDPAEGGFGGAPKFPRPAVLTFLHRYAASTGSGEALRMSVRTLDAMAAGGMADHLGGGFHRYSTDAAWRVPHFEKMLYDQAQLVHAYLDGYLLTQAPAYARVVHETIRYVLQDLTDSSGAFLSAEDADSPDPQNPEVQREGAFYVWTKREIEGILGEEAPLFCAAYGVATDGNAPADPHGEFTGRNILYRAATDGELARTFGREPGAVAAVLARLRARLLAARALRPRPHRDDKVLTSWNGLMIGACARAGSVLGVQEYGRAAERAAEFVLARLRDPAEGVLLRRFRDGEARHPAHLEDYAFLCAGLLELYRSTGETRRLQDAIRLTEEMVRLFGSEEGGGFFDTSGRDPSVLVRMTEEYDGAEPAGSSVAVVNLLELGHLTGRRKWRERAERVLATAGRSLREHPHIMPVMAAGLALALEPPRQVVIAGRRGAEDTEALLAEVRAVFAPGRVVVVRDPDDPDLPELAPYTRPLLPINGSAAAYVCENYSCTLPVTTPEALRGLLRSAAS